MDEVRLPVIDLAAGDASQRILAAAVEHGFLFVKQSTSGMSQAQIDTMFAISRDFFAAPDSVKAEATINSKTSGKNRGWLAMHKEKLDPSKQKRGDFKEAFNIGEFQNDRAQQTLPGPLAAAEADLSTFTSTCHNICIRILDLLGEALHISESDGGKNWFSIRHKSSAGTSGSVLRLLHYPPLPSDYGLNPEDDIRAGAHSDYGSVTLLFRLPHQPGLEIQASSGQWSPVPLDPEPSREPTSLPILVNIGDVLSFWTNGLLKSTVHRVSFPGPGKAPTGGVDRYSIAYFCHPLDDARLVNVPSTVVQEYGLKHSTATERPEDGVMTARDHLNSRLAATYGIG